MGTYFESLRSVHTSMLLRHLFPPLGSRTVSSFIFSGSLLSLSLPSVSPRFCVETACCFFSKGVSRAVQGSRLY